MHKATAGPTVIDGTERMTDHGPPAVRILKRTEQGGRVRSAMPPSLNATRRISPTACHRPFYQGKHVDASPECASFG
jgi:hypothetical protein